MMFFPQAAPVEVGTDCRYPECPLLFFKTPVLSGHDPAEKLAFLIHTGQAADEHFCVFLLCRCVKPADIISADIVVPVHEGEVLSPRHVKSPVSGRRHSPVLLADVDNTAVPCRQTLQYFPAPVRAPVIDHKNLQIPEGLPRHRTDTFFHEFFTVVNRYDHRYFRHSFLLFPVPVQEGRYS